MRHGRFISSSFIGLACLLLTTGCGASRRYEITTPGPSRGDIAQNAGTLAERDKVDYEFFQLEEKVIIRFVNRTGKPIRLAEQSVLIDSAGRRFAVEPQEIGVNESGRIALPPSVPEEKDQKPPIATEVRIGGIDEGGLIGTRRDMQHNAGGMASGSAAAPPPGFRWLPNQVIRARLVYEIADNPTLSHDWSIRRTK